MANSGNNIADHNKVRLRAVFVPDSENIDHTALGGITDPVILKAELTLDQDGDQDFDSGIVDK